MNDARPVHRKVLHRAICGLGALALSAWIAGCGGSAAPRSLSRGESSAAAGTGGTPSGWTPLGCSRSTPPSCARLELNDPRDYQVVQRDGRNGAEVVVRGRLSASGARIRLVAQSADGKQVASEIREVDAAGATGTFQTSLRLPAGGWYQLWVQETPADGRRALAETVVEHLGVGEVFLTAGQSNSVAAGEAPQTDAQLSSGATLQGNTAAWSATIDPPGGPGGTPWPTFAAMLVGEIGVPVAVMSVGCAATSSKQWLPADLGADPVQGDHCGAEATRPGALYQRLVRGVRALGNLRAILWHQGEGDAGRGVTAAEYGKRLQQIVARLAADSGVSQQWMVANASYIPGSEIDANTCALRGAPLQHYDKMWPVRAAQQWLWTHGLIHRGPDTDGLIGKDFRYPGARGACIHFSDAGLRLHGALWYQAVGDAGIVPGMSAPSTVATHLLYRHKSDRDHYLTPASIDLSGYGYLPEGPAMRVYSAPPANPHTLYPCISAGGNHFLSTDAACESNARDGEPVGYLSKGAAVGTRFLYRFISPSPRADLLSTVLLDEGYGAGYILQAIQGFTPRWDQAIEQPRSVPPAPQETDTSPATPVARSCAGGTATFQSPDGSNTCTSSWSEATPGQTISATASGTPVGKGRLTCGADGTWDYHYSCPASNEIQTCPAGRTTVQSPDGSNTCTFTWPQGNPGQTISVVGHQVGSGTMSCASTGLWTHSYLCPNAEGKTCPGGSGTYPSSSGRPGCVFSWPLASSGDHMSVVGSRGGTLAGTCSLTGRWIDVTYRCP
jgi:hypothetical protein